MDTCATCKHWDRQKPMESGHKLGLGRCKNVPQLWDATDWDEEGLNFELVEKYRDRKAFAEDGSSYMAHLLTMPDFGCISHTPLDKPLTD